MSFDLQSYLKDKQSQFDDVVAARWFPKELPDPEKLYESMRYSLFAPGKRIRPILTLASAEAQGIPAEDVWPMAASLEMIHVFSLIHDDLPCMDDDDLRRGQPTNHKVYGEAVAVLAGDALLAQAFVPIMDLNREKYGADAVFKVLGLICEAGGAPGMIGGQIIDLESEGQQIPLQRLQTLHKMKTGALIRAAVLGPAILASASAETQERLENYAHAIGLAFQIADDILDIEGGEEIGKDVGSDVERGKSTYPSLLGLDGAKAERTKMYDLALSALSEFGDGAEPLRAIARYIVERKK